MGDMQRQRTLSELNQLCNEAEEKGFWLNCSYQNIIFSPKELREHNANGKFLWGVVNWRFVDPNTLLKNEAIELEKIRQHNKSILQRML